MTRAVHSRVGLSLKLTDEESASAGAFMLAALHYCKTLRVGRASDERQRFGQQVTPLR